MSGEIQCRKRDAEMVKRPMGVSQSKSRYSNASTSRERVASGASWIPPQEQTALAPYRDKVHRIDLAPSAPFSPSQVDATEEPPKLFTRIASPHQVWLDDAGEAHHRNAISLVAPRSR